MAILPRAFAPSDGTHSPHAGGRSRIGDGRTGPRWTCSISGERHSLPILNAGRDSTRSRYEAFAHKWLEPAASTDRRARSSGDKSCQREKGEG